MSYLFRIVATLSLFLMTAGVAAAQPSTDPVDPVDGCNHYEETGHNLCGVFLDYWNDNGGLPVFGYPITEAFQEENWDTGETYLVQYFERERMEHHTALVGTEYEILLGRLGNEVLLKQGRNWHDFEKSSPTEENYFGETGFAVPQVFMDYWMSHGLDLGDPGISFRESLALFGYPISQAETETNADGDTVLTQWFERARFEHHPDNPEGQQVLLGRLGVEILADDTPPDPAFTVVADSLDNPRGIFAAGDGTLYVAESGVPGDDCYIATPPDAEEGEVCVGFSGTITSIGNGKSTVIGGLPAATFGGFTIGPQDVVVSDEGDVFAVVGGQGSPQELGQFGHLVQADGEGGWTTIADFYAYEVGANPENEGIPSNPYSLVIDPQGGFVVADSAANALFRVSAEGEISPLVEIEARMVDAPPFLELPEGEQIPMDVVPTGLTLGPDGAFYFGELTGFPFPVGEARVWRVTPDGEASVYADGFTTVIDVAFDSDGNLYVLEMVSGGLLNADPENPETFASALIRVDTDGGRTTVADDGLFFATGLEIGPDGSIYVSNNGVTPGQGQVVRIDTD